MGEHVFGTEPITAWRLFYWKKPLGDESDMTSLFHMAAAAPAGVNPFAYALRPRLTGVGYHVPWLDGKRTEARCMQGCENAPTAGCSCGLWGLRTFRQALKASRGYHTRIIGRVALWGHFIEQAWGYRAQYGAPQELIFVLPWNASDELRQAAFADEVGAQYGIPARVHRLKLFGRPRKRLTWLEEDAERKLQAREKIVIPSSYVTGFVSATSASASSSFTLFQQSLAQALPPGVPGSAQKPGPKIHTPDSFWYLTAHRLLADPFKFFWSHKPSPPMPPGGGA